MRPTTLSKEWRRLLDAVGGVSAICDALDMSPTTFHRASRGQVAFRPEKKELLETLCNACELPNPLASSPKPFSRNLSQLRLLGIALEKGMPAARRELKRLRAEYPTEQLTKLAESDETPEHIMRAVQVLLEEA